MMLVIIMQFIRFIQTTNLEVLTSLKAKEILCTVCKMGCCKVFLIFSGVLPDELLSLNLIKTQSLNSRLQITVAAFNIL